MLTISVVPHKYNLRHKNQDATGLHHDDRRDDDRFRSHTDVVTDDPIVVIGMITIITTGIDDDHGRAGSRMSCFRPINDIAESRAERRLLQQRSRSPTQAITAGIGLKADTGVSREI